MMMLQMSEKLVFLRKREGECFRSMGFMDIEDRHNSTDKTEMLL